MTSWKRVALFTAVLGTLGTFGAVGAATLGAGDAAAVPCCSACDAGFDRCVGKCTTFECESACFSRWAPCYNTCSSGC